MAKQQKSIAGLVIAITGGARGIGRATAEALIRKGAKISIGDIDADLAAQTAAEIGGGTVAFGVDVTDRASFESFIDQTESALGAMDVIINNAGIMPIGPLVDEGDEIAHRMIDINLHGVIYGSKIALRRFLARGSGHIVNIASQAGKAGIPGGATYCATKHAVVGLSEAIHGEMLDHDRIAVSCVMPAVVNTELGSGLYETRGVKKLEPADVADAIVEALETNRFDVWVPRSTAALNRIGMLLPRRGREAIAKALNADKVLAQPDTGVRAAYEARAAGAEESRSADRVG